MTRIVSLLIVFFMMSRVSAQTAATVEKKHEIPAQERANWERRSSILKKNTVASVNFNVNFYRCEWEIDPTVRYIKGSVTSYFTITSVSNSITYDLHSSLRVDSVHFRNNKIGFSQTPNDALTITFPQTLAGNTRDSVRIFYQGVPGNDGSGSFVTYAYNGRPVMWTLSEPYGSKDWWPCKNGVDDKADSIDIVISNPEIYSTSSNGLLFSDTVAGGIRTSYWKHRYPIASYLVAISVAEFEVDHDIAQVNGKSLPLKMYSYPGLSAYYKFATAAAKICLTEFSSRFGDYPFMNESYSQTNYEWGGGMEHQTNSFITGAWDQLIAHELGHQWFGNKVTCTSWQDIWLNEGFAQYTQYIFLEKADPSILWQHRKYYLDLVVSKNDGSVKVYDTTQPQRIFDGRLSYAKGSIVVHMLRWRLGDSLFFSGIRKYLNDPKLSYGFASTADLQRNLEEISGQDFTEFFKDWYEGEGHPSYQVKWSVNKNNWTKIKLDQTTSHPSVSFFEMPVPVLLKKGNLDTIVVLNHTRNGEEFWVNPGFVPDSVAFDPDIMLLSANNTVTKIAADSDKGDDIKLYPNPVSEKINIFLINPTNDRVSIRLTNMAGQTLFRKEIQLSGRDELIEIPASSLTKGLYTIQLYGNDGLRWTKKILK